MRKALVNGLIGILQRDVLTDHGNAYAVGGVNDTPHKLLPFIHLGLGHGNTEHLRDDAVHAVAAQIQRALVNAVLHVTEGHHIARRYVTEHADFLLFFLGKVVHLRAADDDIRLNTNLAQLSNTLLRGLGLGFTRCFNIRQ